MKTLHKKHFFCEKIILISTEDTVFLMSWMHSAESKIWSENNSWTTFWPSFCACCVFAHYSVACARQSVCSCVSVMLNGFSLSLQKGLTIREAHSFLSAKTAVQQGNVLGDMFYSPTSLFTFTSPLSWCVCVCQLCPGRPFCCSLVIVENINQYWELRNRKGPYWCCGISTSVWLTHWKM